MQRKKQIKLLSAAIKLLIYEGRCTCDAQIVFGYRERIKIERALFLLSKCLCHIRLAHDLQGLCQFHKERLFRAISAKKKEDLFGMILDRIFHLKIFIQRLCSENAYVRGDILSQVGLTKKEARGLIKFQIDNIIKKIKLLDV